VTPGWKCRLAWTLLWVLTLGAYMGCIFLFPVVTAMASFIAIFAGILGRLMFVIGWSTVDWIVNG
jgi:hypothetical protein